ncbi:hypothetical protein EON65_09315 [archaeon]|nr:MAG: hypothetical protein EON65_09315 [archaeon]
MALAACVLPHWFSTANAYRNPPYTEYDRDEWYMQAMHHDQAIDQDNIILKYGNGEDIIYTILKNSMIVPSW